MSGRADELRRAHAAAHMTGWDFSRFGNRLTSDDPPWDFEAACVDAMRGATSVLDLGTGGGERLIALVAALGGIPSAAITATEGWAPNEPIAAAALAPLGIEVHHYDAETDPRLPFADAAFDLVMSRHEGYDAAEVARVLRPGGLFCTQQVAGDDAQELRDWFGGEQSYPHVQLEVLGEQARAAGLEVTEAADWTGEMSFADADTLVEYLATTPWDVPGFAVDDHVDELLRLDASAPIRVRQRRFWFIARKPGAAETR